MKAEELRKQFAKDVNLEDEQSAIHLDAGIIFDYVTWLEEYAQSQLPKESSHYDEVATHSHSATELPKEGEEVSDEEIGKAANEYLESVKSETLAPIADFVAGVKWMHERTTLSLPTDYIEARIRQLKSQLGEPEILDQRRIEMKLEVYQEIKGSIPYKSSLPTEEELDLIEHIVVSDGIASQKYSGNREVHKEAFRDAAKMFKEYVLNMLKKK